MTVEFPQSLIVVDGRPDYNIRTSIETYLEAVHFALPSSSIWQWKAVLRRVYQVVMESEEKA